MAKKTKYNKAGIERLPADKPVIYRIKTRTGKTNYIGSAKCGRVRQRIGEHLGSIPGSTVEIEQFNRIKDAREREAKAIKYSKPKHNKRGK